MTVRPTELPAPARLAAFGAALLVVLAASFAIGRVTGDIEQARPQMIDHQMSGGQMGDHAEGSS